MRISTKQIEDFRKTVWSHYKNNKRDFAWRNTSDPYQILVSEFMLQQTQTIRILEKFTEFIKAFPTVKDLAEASLSDVLKLWQGLGYNRRAKFLYEAAKKIQMDFNGIVPLNIEQLDSLPGIGPYTARAIYTFSTNLPSTFIETNIRTVFIHHFFKDSDVDDKEILKLVEQTLDTSDPRNWYYALMDYGVYIKKSVGNLNIKSKHYSKQSKFEGSKRQVRGQILKTILQSPIKKEELLGTIQSAHDTNLILKGLIDEGMLLEDKNGTILINNVQM